MNFVVATLIVFQRDEAAVFWTFVTLMQQENEPLRELYLPDMRETSVACRVLDHLLERHLPALAAHFRKFDIPCIHFCAEWYVTLFSRSFPVSLVARIFDVLLAERDTKILHRIALLLLKSAESDLLKLDDMGELLMRVKELPENVKHWPGIGMGDLVAQAYAIPVTQAEITKIREMIKAEGGGGLRA